MTHLDQQRYSDAARWLSAVRRPLIVTHAKADGDAVGAVAAMRSVARLLGVEPLALVFEHLPERYTWFCAEDPLPVYGRDVRLAQLAACDAVVICDTGSFNQLEPIRDWLRDHPAPRMIIDHHVTRDIPAELQLIDEQAAAACLVVYDWVRAMGWKLDELALDALFVGIATDTGWFRHSNTDARALAAAAALAEEGVDVNHIFARVYQTDAPARLRLAAHAVCGLELLADGAVAVMQVPQADIARLGARPSDTEDLVNEPLRIRTVRVSILLVEQADGVVRANFRSKPPLTPGEPDISVAQIALALGGGGHTRAAGARFNRPLAEVRTLVTDAVIQALSR